MRYLAAIFLLPLSLLANDFEVECPTCSEHFIIKTQTTVKTFTAGIWGDTWVCPNINCAYENYTAINRCALCGTQQPGNRG